MNSGLNLAEALSAWAAREKSIKAVIWIGSRIRESSDSVWRADAFSDWDFQIITTAPALFANPAWLKNLPGFEARAYAVRAARIGGIPKVNVVFAQTEADFVVLPCGTFRFLALCVKLGVHRHSAWLRSRLQDLAVVVRPGWRFLKGAGQWEDFYRRTVAEISDRRLDEEGVLAIAEGFVCDYVSISKKIARGELCAVQRLLHRDLVELNFRLLHELKLRNGERTFPEARRLERIASPVELESVTTNARNDKDSLRSAVEKTADTFRQLVDALVGDRWRWPDL